MYDNYLSVINIAMKTKEGGVKTNGKEGEGVIWIQYIRVQGILLLLSQHHNQPVSIYNHDFVLILSADEWCQVVFYVIFKWFCFHYEYFHKNLYTLPNSKMP